MYGAKVHADDVLVLAPEEGIFLSMQALLQPEDEVSQQSPLSFDSGVSAAKLLVGSLSLQDNQTMSASL